MPPRSHSSTSHLHLSVLERRVHPGDTEADLLSSSCGQATETRESFFTLQDPVPNATALKNVPCLSPRKIQNTPTPLKPILPVTPPHTAFSLLEQL